MYGVGARNCAIYAQLPDRPQKDPLIPKAVLERTTKRQAGVRDKGREIRAGCL